MKKTIKILLAAAMVFSFQLSEYNSLKAQDAEYNLIRRQYTVNSDGTMDINFRKEIKLLRNRAITAYADKGETFILYNPAIDELTINESYTIRKDGTRVNTPQNAFVDQLPSQCENCGRYNGIRERAVIHTALEYDCIIVLDYTIHRKGTYLDETIVLSEDCPVKKYEVIFDVPGNADTYSAKHTNGLDNTKVRVLNDKHTFHCVANKLPQNYNDNYLPDARILYPIVHLTYGNGGAQYDSYDDDNFASATNLLGELYDSNPMTYVTNIRDYVVDNIRTNDFPLALVGYEVSPAEVTFQSACGTPKDKERLTIALLRAAGFNAYERNSFIIVRVPEEGREMEYALSAVHKGQPRLSGAAMDDQRTIDVTETIPWQGNSIGNGYKQMTLPSHPGSISINPSLLASNRTAPIRVRNCNERYHYTILLPRTPKHLLVGKPIEIKRTESGVGSIYIRISQNSNGEIEVIRHIDINVKNEIVTSKQYKAFRSLMQDWYTYSTITIKAQPGRPLNQ